jgi:TonB family protein
MRVEARVEGNDHQKVWLKGFLLLSVTCHILFVILDGKIFSHLWRKPPPTLEDSIETDLIMAEDALPPAPQLPSKVQVKAEVVNHLPEPKKAKVEEAEKVEKKVESKPVEEASKFATTKQETSDQFKKREAINRLLENQKTDKDARRQEKDRLKKALAKLKRDVAVKSDVESGQYPSEILTWIRKFYTLPETYQYVQLPDPVIEINLTVDGGISKMSVIKTSTDSGLDHVILAAIQSAAPFPTPPGDLVGYPIQFTFKIH